MDEADSITLLRDGAEAFPAMLDAIEAAEREVVLEMYWLDSTPIGRRFVEALTARARAGVEVCVLYDAIGSLGADTSMYAPLVDAGGRVMEFNPIAPWRKRFRLTRISQRDHRKILVVDGAVAFTGGLNIGAPWLPAEDGGEGWRDDVVRVEGRAARELRQLFYDTWLRFGGPAPREADVSRRRSRELRVAASRELARTDDPRVVAVLGHNAWGARRAIRRAYLTRVRGAREKILIANAYFLPDNTVRRALERAARRGVEVRVMVPRMGDVPSVTYATRALFAGMLRNGVHVHEWVRGVLHNKTGLVDGWATTGSYNLDYRSLRYNLEANVASAAPGFVAQVEASLRRDLQDSCEPVDLAAWRRRPWREKVLEWTCYLARKWL